MQTFGSYRLTMHELSATNIQGYLQRVVTGEWFGAGTSGKPLGAWQSTVGPLNRVFLIHDAKSDLAYDAPLSDDSATIIPQMRDVQLLTAIRPVGLPSAAMVVELREYELIPGGLAKYVPLLLDALPARERYSKNIGLWISGSGGIDRLIHMWAYRDSNERADIRPALNADAVWREFVPRVLPLIKRMQSCLLAPIV